MNPFLYTVYGLTIALPIELPGLASVESEGDVDVRVSFGATPERLQDAPDDSKPFQVAGDRMLLRIPTVARFLIRDGSDIVIEKEKEADDDDVRLFLLGSVMGAVLHYRGITPLHGTFCKHAIPLKRIYILVKGEVPSITLEDLSNVKSLFQMKRHTYRKHMIKPLGREPAHFKRCGKIVTDAEVRKITRPSHGFFLDELVECVEKDLG